MTSKSPKDDDIEERLSALKLEVDRESRRMDEYIKKRALEESNIIALIRKTQSELSEEYKKSQKLKEDILSYTFQVVSIIIGIFAIILSITFLWLNREEISTELANIYLAVVILFIVVFTDFFILWIYKNFFKK